TGRDKGPLLAFALAGAPSPQAIAAGLDEAGIAVRAGSFCSRPLLHVLGVPGLCRARFGLCNTVGEVDSLRAALEPMTR
ncbi:MAG TPA: aminotransferase class V-fold PLP-dependent enzyme, partial [Amaricoccus sp.]|nr:aminotransferase class V-fold PLP-dependent enzyme [Amaricoccus sp.]